MKFRVWQIPLLLLIAVFLLDKLLMFPGVLKCCFSANEFDEMYNEVYENAFYEKEEYYRAKLQGKKIIFNFGSSLSYGFDLVNYDIPASYLKTGSKKVETGNYRVFNFYYPFAGIITHYYRLSGLVNQGFKPDVVFIEMSPATINSGSSNKKREIRNIPLSVAISNIDIIPVSHLLSALMNGMFFINRYEPVFLQNSDKSPVPKIFHNNWTKMYLMNGAKEFKKMLAYFPEENSIMFDLFVEANLNELIKYSIDPETRMYLAAINNYNGSFPVIFWGPIIHPVFAGNKKISHALELWKLNLKKQKNHVDLNEEQIKCRGFLDPVHGLPECFPEFYNVLQKKAVLVNSGYK